MLCKTGGLCVRVTSPSRCLQPPATSLSQSPPCVRSSVILFIQNSAKSGYDCECELVCGCVGVCVWLCGCVVRLRSALTASAGPLERQQQGIICSLTMLCSLMTICLPGQRQLQRSSGGWFVLVCVSVLWWCVCVCVRVSVHAHALWLVMVPRGAHTSRVCFCVQLRFVCVCVCVRVWGGVCGVWGA